VRVKQPVETEHIKPKIPEQKMKEELAKIPIPKKNLKGRKWML
jgi:hypothetical protein